MHLLLMQLPQHSKLGRFFLATQHSLCFPNHVHCESQWVTFPAFHEAGRRHQESFLVAKGEKTLQFGNCGGSD